MGDLEKSVLASVLIGYFYPGQKGKRFDENIIFKVAELRCLADGTMGCSECQPS